jgi:hypothetical protein
MSFVGIGLFHAPEKSKKMLSKVCNAPEDKLQLRCLRRIIATQAQQEVGKSYGLLDKGKPIARWGRKAMGLNRSEGGTDKVARLPKGWTGPVS